MAEHVFGLRGVTGKTWAYDVCCTVCGETFPADIRDAQGWVVAFLDPYLLKERCAGSEDRRLAMIARDREQQGQLLALLIATRVGVVRDEDGIDPVLSNYVESLFDGASTPYPLQWSTDRDAECWAYMFAQDDEAALFCLRMRAHDARQDRRTERLHGVVISSTPWMVAKNVWEKRKLAGMGDPKVGHIR